MWGSPLVNEQALLGDLVAAIEAWVQGGRNRSLSGLARKTNVAYSTIRRIAQNESVPHPYTALSIVEVVLPAQERLEFLKKHFPLVGNLMDECYDRKATDGTHVEEDVRRILRLDPHNLVFNIAATRAGTTRAAIRERCGQAGIDAIDDMIEAGILLESAEGKVHFVKDTWIHANADDMLEQVRQSTLHFDKRLIGTLGANLMHATGAIRPEKLPVLKTLVTNFIRDVIALKEDEAAEGDIHFFCDLLYSLYDRTEYPSETEINK